MDERFNSLFDKYNCRLKPLVAKIEGRFERFETPLLENLMDFWETIVQLHFPQNAQNRMLLEQAERKLDESISQSFVYMISGYKDDVKFFERRTSKRARHSFESGCFQSEYNKWKKEANDNIRLINKSRHRKWNLKYNFPDFLKSYDSNEKAYNAYREISEMISNQNTATVLYRSESRSSVWSLLGWVAGIGISVLVGIYAKPLIGMIQQWLQN